LLGERKQDLLAPAPDEPAVLSWTSGTTGSPKAFLLTHRNIATNIEAFQGQQRTTFNVLGLTRNSHQVAAKVSSGSARGNTGGARFDLLARSAWRCEIFRRPLLGAREHKI
jgi:acyl-CoA synthetase (AMP-forming)/AMP-acid ligase II